MGLDIYCRKTRLGKNIDPTNVKQVSRYYYTTKKRSFRSKLDNLVNECDKHPEFFDENHTTLEEYRNYISKLYTFVKNCFGDYTWEYEWLNGEDVETLHPDACQEYLDRKREEITRPTLSEFHDRIAKMRKWYWPREDVYFRKVNFVYRYFSDRLVNEECIVTKDDVIDLISRCVRIIDAAATCGGWLKEDNSGILPQFYSYYYINEKNSISAEFMLVAVQTEDEKKKLEEIQKRNERIHKTIEDYTNSLDDGWMDLAEELLPTQSGFFFGRTSYDAYYLADVCRCRKQFTNLLNKWKKNDIAFISMSW